MATASLHVSGQSFFALAPGQIIQFTRLKKFSKGQVVEIQGAAARARLCSDTNEPVEGKPRDEIFVEDLEPLGSAKDRRYLLDELGEPMILLILPSSTLLRDANPNPEDAWREGDRICAFWQKPNGERKIEFRLSGLKQSTNLEKTLEDCAQHWRKQSAPSSAERIAAHPIIAIIVCLVMVAAISVSLIKRLGEVAAGTWVAAIGGVATFIVPFVLSRLGSRHRAYKGPRLGSRLKVYKGPPESYLSLPAK
jgi:hypothetical protein